MAFIMTNNVKMPHPFIYDNIRSFDICNKSLELLKNNEKLGAIGELAWIYHSIQELIPHTLDNLWSGHFFPVVESWEELQVSFNLCLQGFYKQAMVSLRSALETGLLSVYWNLNDDGHETIKSWLRSGVDTPRLFEIWQKLIKHNNFTYFQNKYDLKNRLLSLGYLHNYVHTKGYKFSNKIGIVYKSNYQTLEITAIDKWFTAYEEVIKILAILHLIKYPIGLYKFDYYSKFGIDKPPFGGLEDNQIINIENLLGKDIIDILNELLVLDENAIQIIKWISELPDITEEQVEQQIINLDKSLIEGMGLEGWLKQEKSILSNPPSEKVNKRITFLTEWAKEKGFLLPAFERNSLKQ